MRGVRPPAVAGLFYPAGRHELGRLVDDLLADAAGRVSGDPPKALIVPHAGYVYSGSTAALAYARIASARDRITRVVMFGPTHRVAVRGLALPGVRTFRTPLGDVPIADVDLAGLPQVVVSDQVHAEEHSLEVQVPFLQRILPRFDLLPFAVGQAPADEVAQVIDRCWGGPETLLVFSSDLSHYHPYEEARTLDAETVQRMLDFDGPIDPRRACGAKPVNGLLVSASRRGLNSQLLGVCNSGDTAGDRDRVVGYASIGVG